MIKKFIISDEIFPTMPKDKFKAFQTYVFDDYISKLFKKKVKFVNCKSELFFNLCFPASVSDASMWWCDVDLLCCYYEGSVESHYVLFVFSAHIRAIPVPFALSMSQRGRAPLGPSKPFINSNIRGQ